MISGFRRIKQEDKDTKYILLEELFLAGIPATTDKSGEGKWIFPLKGKLGEWDFFRAEHLYYWIARAPDGKGLPLEVAVQLHERQYPIIGEDQPEVYGQVVRANGDYMHPKFLAPHYDSLGRLLIYDPKGQSERIYKKALAEEGRPSQECEDRFHYVRTKKERIRLTAQSLIEFYHIDNQIGLNELARVIRG